MVFDSGKGSVLTRCSMEAYTLWRAEQQVASGYKRIDRRSETNGARARTGTWVICIQPLSSSPGDIMN